MPLRENETVAFRIVGARNAQHLSVERSDDLDNRQRRPDVADVGPLRTCEDRSSNLCGERVQTAIISCSLVILCRGQGASSCTTGGVDCVERDDRLVVQPWSK